MRETIADLSEEMKAEKIQTRVTASNADCIIIRTYWKNNAVVTNVGEDVNLVAILITITPSAKKISFIKPATPNLETSFFRSRELKISLCCRKAGINCIILCNS